MTRRMDFAGRTVLVAGAGVVTGRPLLDASDDVIRRTFEVNTLALLGVNRTMDAFQGRTTP